jgi:hypothetical protein
MYFFLSWRFVLHAMPCHATPEEAFRRDTVIINLVDQIL